MSHVSIGLGDKNLAYQALKVAVSLNCNHAEALTNLGVLEFQRGNADGALSNYRKAQEVAPALYEALYNGGLSAYKGGQLESAYNQVQAALANYPEFVQVHELLRLIVALLSVK